MRVVHFLGTMRPGHDGVTRVTYRLRDGFALQPDHRHSFVSAIVPNPAPPDIVGVPSIPFPLYPDYRISVSRAEQIKRLLAREEPDVIHLHSPCSLGWAAGVAAKDLGIPVVATYHTHFPTYLKYYKLNLAQPWLWRYLEFIYNHCQTVIVPSKTTLKELAQKNFPNLIHIPHGVDTSRFSPAYRSSDWRKKVGGVDKTIVTFAGRLVWEKNIRLLAEAAEHLNGDDSLQFVIVGDGPARAKLEKMMPRAYFTGFLGETDLPVAYASSDIFTFPSVTETFGNVTVEAMASGLPAICVAEGGACDIVEHGVNGLLVPSKRDSQEFASAIQRVAGDKGSRLEMSAAALKSAQTYQWERSVSQYCDLYQSLTNH